MCNRDLDIVSHADLIVDRITICIFDVCAGVAVYDMAWVEPTVCIGIG